MLFVSDAASISMLADAPSEFVSSASDASSLSTACFDSLDSARLDFGVCAASFFLSAAEPPVALSTDVCLSSAGAGSFA